VTAAHVIREGDRRRRENRDDPDLLLLIGSDGQHYQYRLPEGTTTPVEPDKEWVIDPHAPPIEDVLG
jgi:hypothetical protein